MYFAEPNFSRFSSRVKVNEGSVESAVDSWNVGYVIKSRTLDLMSK